MGKKLRIKKYCARYGSFQITCQFFEKSHKSIVYGLQTADCRL
jgi:hypothetical protein